jgi:hypothetical protein
MVDAEDEVRMPGNTGGATRVGATVRRRTGPWTPAVHALLAHLSRSGLAGIPEVHGFDDAGREVLSFLPGRSIDVDAEVAPDALLAEAVSWTRRFHDTVRSFDATGLRWRNASHDPEPGEIICHHDLGAYNWVVDGDHLVGIIDWDMSGPGRPIDELAFMAWNSLPLYREIALDDIVRRLRLMVEVYGDPGITPVGVLDHVDARMTAATARITEGQRAGDPGMLHLATVGEPERTVRRLAALRDRLPGIRAGLGRAE